MFADYVKPRECSLGSLRVSAKGRLLANATGDNDQGPREKGTLQNQQQLQYVRKSEARK